jgi:hypothetical protein
MFSHLDISQDNHDGFALGCFTEANVVLDAFILDIF